MSSDTLHPISALAGEHETGGIAGSIGTLVTLPIDQLYVDATYQRAITAGSVNNIKRICARFDWAKFLPVIVTEEDGRYCIVDGQHRTTAAATIGLKAVPCYILSCSASEAAAAFAAINGNVTPVQPVDLWFAELAAKSTSALALQKVLDAAGVVVTRKKEGFLVGETRSINVLRRSLDSYGSSTLITVLQCIVETGNGNPGMIFGATINGIGQAIRTKPDLLAAPSKLFEVFDQIDLAELLQAARVENAQTANPVQYIVTRRINDALKTGVSSHAT